MRIEDYLRQGFCQTSLQYKQYLSKRLVSDSTSLDFFCWQPPAEVAPCSRFTSSFGARGEKLRDFLITPIYSYGGGILAFEARKILKEDSKYVL